MIHVRSVRTTSDGNDDDGDDESLRIILSADMQPYCCLFCVTSKKSSLYICPTSIITEVR